MTKQEIIYAIATLSIVAEVNRGWFGDKVLLNTVNEKICELLKML